MESNLLMNFTVDKENKTVNIKREFRASLSDVWSAWTEAEILDQWWAPAPFKSQTKSMEFKEGGRRLYAMVGLEGEERWSSFDYTSISPKTNFKYASTFCDSEGNPNSEFASSYWSVSFSEQDNSTFVDIAIKRDSLPELEKLIEMGFKEGITVTMKSLDKIFENRK
ncbi:SRPBCC family protein [Flavobacterium hibernum]|uniref:ATPase n=1 Tax=Flavobacterium hibernum TaxID=37752 RepID=A0A0D0EW09_9FLAO|nr:SRPBCC domain-containing protein [Flavobacterium hibernum]KIO51216.1 ATPase [Flavobacterium hibernum]OXA85173.1 ATPase [Flavobacterium hibernum]STO19548.1 Activator of Hsp90 ATPase homolog 1-like protein [Flavobacterium hibernum]